VPAADAPLPTFLVIGAPRSGTTSLWRALRAHPDVFMAPAKELRFFSEPLTPESVDGYRAHFAGWAGERAIGEASPVYLYSETRLQRMHDLLPDARLVAILREPVARAYSDYWQRRGDGREDRAFPDVIAEGGSIYVRRSRYLRHLRGVCEVYPRAALHVELFEDLQQEPQAVLARVYGHVGVDPAFVPPDADRQANVNVRFRSQRVRAISRRLPGPLRTVVGRANSSRAEYPPLDEGLARDLRAGFAKERARLGAWLGRDLSEWA
jgi:hypothetical protein